jgi:hypothetical protein
MIYQKDYFGFVYEWTDTKTKMKYIGSHHGSANDSYKGSNERFQRAIKKRPSDFTRQILEYILIDNQQETLDAEQKWLDTVDNIKDNPNYYNKKNEAQGGWSFISEKHINKRSKTLKKKHKKNGLSKKESDSYETKIQTRLKRISTIGFTEREQEQHNLFSTQIKVILPDKTEKFFPSITKCSKELDIDARYGAIVTKNKGNYKGYQIYRIREPIVPCYRSNNESI